MGLLDAVALAAARLQAARHTQRSLWILTDGGEGSFGRTDEQLIAAVHAAQAPVHVFGLTDTQNSREPASRDMATLLEQLVRQTGGTSTTFDQLRSIPGAVTRVVIANRNQYRLEFTPRSRQRQGYHDLAVHVNMPGLDIRARAGYYVP